ncbi:MAG: DUF2070 family protein [Euryarchaeota archaeon]|nr:DUF2070 family protein [Euryarchaeota archaeon]
MESQYRSIELESRVLTLLLEPPAGMGVLLALLGGVAVGFAALLSPLEGGEGLFVQMVLLLGAPAFLSSVAMVWLVPGLRAPSASMMALLGLVEVGVFTLAGQMAGNLPGGFGLGVALSFAYLHSSLLILGGRMPPRSLLGAAPALVFPLLFLAVLRPADATALVPRVLGAAGLLVGAAWGLLLGLSRKLRRELKFSMGDLIRFYSRVLQGHPTDIRPLITGVPGEAWVDTLAFKGPHGTKAIWVSTSVHPGLMRNIGAHDMPREVTRALRDLGPVVFFKGASTHEQDPVENVSPQVAEAVRRSLKEMVFTPDAGDPVQVHHEEAVAVGQALGPAVFLLNTLAPRPTDDLDLRVHGEIERAAGELGAPRLFYVEAHNSHGDDAMILPGTPRAHHLVMASRVAVKGALVEPRRRLRLGVATRPWGSLLLLEPHPGGKRSLLAVFDENNILPEARRRAIETLAVPGLVPSESIEVCTSDNHRSIDPLHIHRPMTLEMVARLRKSLLDALEQAERGLEEVEMGYGRQTLSHMVYGRRIMEMKEFWENHRKRGRLLVIPLVAAAHLGAILLFLL